MYKLAAPGPSKVFRPRSTPPASGPNPVSGSQQSLSLLHEHAAQRRQRQMHMPDKKGNRRGKKAAKDNKECSSEHLRAVAFVHQEWQRIQSNDQAKLYVYVPDEHGQKGIKDFEPFDLEAWCISRLYSKATGAPTEPIKEKIANNS